MAKQPSMDRLQKELARIMEKRNEMDQRIRELEDKILELKRSEIIGMVEEANLTPQDLAIVIGYAKNGVLGVIPGKEETKSEN